MSPNINYNDDIVGSFDDIIRPCACVVWVVFSGVLLPIAGIEIRLKDES
jgi:hypothetical protein